MKVKKVLKFYFNAERAERLIDGLIYRKAASINYARPAGECAEEVAELVNKKAEMCAFYYFLQNVINAFGEDEVRILKKYALSRGLSASEAEKKFARRVAVKFARRLCGCSQKYSAGIETAFSFSFIV